MNDFYPERLKKLRETLAKRGVDGFIVPRADEHLGEYVPQCAERLAFISGFTGSAGMAIILPERAAVFTDGRYTLQLETETDPAAWERLHITETPPESWLRQHAGGRRIGYDPWLISADGLVKFQDCTLVGLDGNPIDEIWDDRPPIPLAPAVPHQILFAGESVEDKRERLAQILRDAGQDAALLTDPASLAWLFNLRGSDVPFTPIALGFSILRADASATIFMHGSKVPAATRTHLGNQVALAEPSELPDALVKLSGKSVRYDPASMPAWFKARLEDAGAKISPAVDPVSLPRALKNATEQAGTRTAHHRDGVAMTRFLAWLSAAAPRGAETEMSAAARLLALRTRGALFQGESFPAISGAGEHGAIIHYRVSPETNRPINPNEVFLIDSGGQYSDGTTDITRTIWTGPDDAPREIKEHFTRVLAGHIALSTAIFPEGVAGAHLDALARVALWQAGLDYDHGTGHGVGSYLSVHEGPAGISRAAKPVVLQPGMILSNEPGYYLPGEYGIRLENLELVQPASFGAQRRKFLRFETLTLAPFDQALVDPQLLPPASLQWLNDYHLRVRRELGDALQDEGDEAVRAWLEAATTPI
jgi:Xaa-Pro aminopeptidase